VNDRPKSPRLKQLRERAGKLRAEAQTMSDKRLAARAVSLAERLEELAEARERRERERAKSSGRMRD
jgi:hypothetical protein